MAASLLVIVGADRDDRIAVRGGGLSVRGASDLHKLIDPRQAYHRLQVTRQLLRQQRRPDLTPYHCLLNLITEPEQNERVLDTLRKLLRGTAARVINPPEAILKTTRDQVARRLDGIAGLWVPKAVRLRTANPKTAGQIIAQAGMKFPLILREAGTHTGKIVGRFDRMEDMLAGLTEGIDHIATEFVDFRSADGLYRKHRVFFFGRQRVFRHKLMSDSWNVHGKDRDRIMIDRPDLIEEEVALFAKPEGAFPAEIGQTLDAVRDRMGLDFFGIDFGIAPDGGVLLFEANATMNFYSTLPGPQFSYLQACLPPARAAFRELLGLESADMEPA